MSTDQLRNRRGTWVFLGAVSGVQLTKATNFEYQIRNVHLVSSVHLPRRRRRFGIKPVLSEIRKRHDGALDYFFKRHTVLAVVRRTGKLSAIDSKVVELVREELAILAASQLGYGARKSNATPSLTSVSKRELTSQLFLNVSKYGWTQPNAALGRLGKLALNDRWRKFGQQVFFTKALEILRSNANTKSSWRRDLKNALVLIGQSQTSIDLPQAFLWNMIALELLLTQQGDKVSKELPRRVEAFLGWTADWKAQAFPDRIRKIYEKRCKLVHQGQRGEIEPKDVVFLDELLLNVLANIVGHAKLFPSKDKLVEFSEKLKAERLLGIAPRVRPKTIRHLRKLLSPRHYEW